MIRGTNQIETCWFCKKAEADPKLMTNDVALYRVLSQEADDTTRYEKTSVKVPACRRCGRLRILDFIFVGAPSYILGIGCAIALWAVFIEWFFSFEFVTNRGGAFWGIVAMFFVLITFGVSLLPGFFIGGMIHQGASRIVLPKDYRESQAADEFAEVKRLTENGWQLGEKPPKN